MENVYTDMSHESRNLAFAFFARLYLTILYESCLTWFGCACPRPVGLGLEDVASDPVPQIAGQRVAAVIQELHAKVPAWKHEPLLMTKQVQ